MALISPLKLNIARRLKEDKLFRKRFFQRQAQDETAMSIRSLREKRKLRQIDLAKKSKMKQSAISRIEQSDYSSWSFTTLLRVADALDARLHVTLEPAETVISLYEPQETVLGVEFKQNCEVYIPSAIGVESKGFYLSSLTTVTGTVIGVGMGVGANWYYQPEETEALTNVGIGCTAVATGVNNREFHKILQATEIAYIGRLPYGDETIRKGYGNKTRREESSDAYPYQMACA